MKLATHIIALCLSALTAEAQLVRVKVLNASGVSDAYMQTVVTEVKTRYRSDLGIRLRVRTSVSDAVSHSLDLEDRFAEFEQWQSKLKPRKVWNRVQFVAVPAYYDENGCSYGAGYATFFGFGVIRGTESCSGADRFDAD